MKPSSTAYGAAFLRAVENLLPEDKRLFELYYPLIECQQDVTLL